MITQMNGSGSEQLSRLVIIVTVGAVRASNGNALSRLLDSPLPGVGVVVTANSTVDHRCPYIRRLAAALGARYSVVDCESVVPLRIAPLHSLEADAYVCWVDDDDTLRPSRLIAAFQRLTAMRGDIAVSPREAPMTSYLPSVSAGEYLQGGVTGHILSARVWQQQRDVFDGVDIPGGRAIFEDVVQLALAQYDARSGFQCWPKILTRWHFGDPRLTPHVSTNDGDSFLQAKKQTVLSMAKRVRERRPDAWPFVERKPAVHAIWTEGGSE